MDFLNEFHLQKNLGLFNFFTTPKTIFRCNFKEICIMAICDDCSFPIDEEIVHVRQEINNIVVKQFPNYTPQSHFCCKSARKLSVQSVDLFLLTIMYNSQADFRHKLVCYLGATKFHAQTIHFLTTTSQHRQLQQILQGFLLLRGESSHRRVGC